MYIHMHICIHRHTHTHRALRSNPWCCTYQVSTLPPGYSPILGGLPLSGFYLGHKDVRILSHLYRGFECRGWETPSVPQPAFPGFSPPPPSHAFFLSVFFNNSGNTVRFLVPFCLLLLNTILYQVIAKGYWRLITPGTVLSVVCGLSVNFSCNPE